MVRLLLLFLGLEIRHKRVPLVGNPLLSPLPCRLGLRPLGIHLFLEDPFTGLLGFGFVDLDAHISTQPSSQS